MATIKNIISDATVFYQNWDNAGETPGEDAIIVKQWNDCLSLIQKDDEILISKHEIKAFIKHLQSIAKTI